MVKPTQFGVRPRRIRGLRPAVYCAAFVLVLACTAEERDYTMFDGSDAGSGGKAGSAVAGKGGKGGAGGKGGSAGSSAGSGSGGDPTGDSGAAGNPDSGGTGGSGTSGDGGAGTGAEGGVGGESASGGEGGSGGEGASGGEANTGGGGTGGGGTGGGGTGGGGTAGSGGLPPCMTSDPDCECVGGVVVARDRDEDGAGAQACEAAPGMDCDDLDQGFIRNACGGCTRPLGGMVGATCNQCGEYRCSGTEAVVCTTPSPPPRSCLNTTTPRVCVATNWQNQSACTGTLPRCLNGVCVECTPGTFRCEDYGSTDDDLLYRCNPNGSWSWLVSCYGSSSEVCNAATGTCVLGMFHPRDASFEVIPALGFDPDEYRRGVPTGDVLDRVTGFRFG